jgi:AcrR family transcriptional regulator
VNGPAHPRDLLLGRVIEWFAANGVLDTSMRTLAAGVGTSNRMLNYHFGSREQLLADVTAKVCEAEDESLRDCLAASEEPVDGAASYWHHAPRPRVCSRRCSTSCPRTRTASRMPSGSRRC